MKDYIIIISMLIPVLKNSKNANVTAIIIDIFVFLYCFALIVFNMISFNLLSLSLKRNITLRIILYNLACSTAKRIMAPNIINTNMELNKIT